MVDDVHDQPTIENEETTKKLESKEKFPDLVPGFRLLQKLGEGGMGEVFEAEQLEPIRRRVALKLIKRGMESKEILARFDAERQALAMMSHPNIAQVFDAGTTSDGRPYFVMEFIKGVPLTRYCDRNRLTTDERLEIFIQICDGVQHAHQKGVIHRDLKPSNILVKIQDSDLVPKIIDFGVAKATAQRLTEQTVFTAVGEFIGTPEYMSPEQAEMTELDIDTRTDVYSLGVVLYELLVGAPPFDSNELRRAGFSEMRRRIREEEPQRPSARLSGLGEQSTTVAANRRSEPSTLTRRLHGDLDWITMKALEKDRTRRYSSPGELAGDIRRHLQDEPVLAGPPSARYRIGKFVRRHTLGVAAGMFVAVALILGIAGITLGLVRAREAERIASREAETAKQVSDFLVGLFEVSDPNQAKGETITAREILDEGANKIRTELDDQPLVQARLMDTMGWVYKRLGLYESSGPLLEEALEIRERNLEPDNTDIASSLNNLASLCSDQGKYEEAEEYLRRALSIRQEAYGPDHPDVGMSLNSLASLYSDQARYEEAEPLFLRTLEIWENDPGPDHLVVATALRNLANLYARQGRYSEAEPLYQRALTIMEGATGPDHPDVAMVLQNLAGLHYEQGEYAEAEPLYRRILAIQEKTLGPDHRDIAFSLGNLANLYAMQGRYAEAEPLYLRVLTILEESLGPDHPEIASTLINYAALKDDQGQLTEAESLNRRALAILENGFGPEHPNVAIGLGNLANVLSAQRNYGEAEAHYLRAMAIFESALGPDHPHIAYVLGGLASMYRETERYDEAENLVLRALAIRESYLEPDHPLLIEFLDFYAGLLRDAGRMDEALAVESRIEAAQAPAEMSSEGA